MTKSISLSNEAYEILKNLKRPKASFSEVIIRITVKPNRKSLLEFAGKWKGDDIEEVFAQIKKDREQLVSRKIEI